MTWFPKVGDSVEDITQPGAIIAVTRVQSYVFVKGSVDAWEVDLLCVVPANELYPLTRLGQTHVVRATLAYMQRYYPCLSL